MATAKKTSKKTTKKAARQATKGDNPAFVSVKEGRTYCVIDKIQVEDGFNFRKNAQPDEELLASIEANNIVHPIQVRWKDKKKSGFLVVDGERRFTAAQQLGMGSVPIVNRGFIDDIDARIVNLVGNRGQKGWSRSELKAGIEFLKKEAKYTPAQIGKLLGIPSRTISEFLAVETKAAPVVKKMTEKGEISSRVAGRVAKLPKKVQSDVVKKIKGKSTDDALKEVRKEEDKLGMTKPGKKAAPAPASESKKPKSEYKNPAAGGFAPDAMERMEQLKQRIDEKLRYNMHHKVANAQLKILLCLQGKITVEDVYSWEEGKFR